MSHVLGNNNVCYLACTCSHQVHTDCPIDLVLANAGIIAAAPPGSSSSSAGIAALADNLWIAAHTNIMGERCPLGHK
jgi:hypothetical protein